MNKIVYNKTYGGFGLSDAAIEWLKSHDWNGERLERHDPLLVKCVEELGEAVNRMCSRLDIKEITGNKYFIDEYDGKETVVEPEDLSWIVIN